MYVEFAVVTVGGTSCWLIEIGSLRIERGSSTGGELETWVSVVEGSRLPERGVGFDRVCDDADGKVGENNVSIRVAN